jgi:hypothetical protein
VAKSLLKLPHRLKQLPPRPLRLRRLKRLLLSRVAGFLRLLMLLPQLRLMLLHQQHQLKRLLLKLPSNKALSKLKTAEDFFRRFYLYWLVTLTGDYYTGLSKHLESKKWQ